MKDGNWIIFQRKQDIDDTKSWRRRSENSPSACFFFFFSFRREVITRLVKTENADAIINILVYELLSLFRDESRMTPQGATQVWFGWGRASETWKIDPFLYQIMPKNKTSFLPQSQILSKIYQKFGIIFQLIVKLSSKFGKFWYKIYEIGPIFGP